MTDANVLALILPVVVAAAVTLLLRKGKPTRVNLMEYQRGVLYNKGFPVKDVGPGSHWVWSGNQLLIHADTRPRSVGYEKLVVTLQDGASAVYGLLASVQMSDVRKAIYSARNYEQAANAALLRCTRLALNQRTSTELRAISQEALTQEVRSDAKSRLAVAGYELLSFRLTELSIVVPSPNHTAPQPSASTMA
jgi:SPFH domain / Band 7 family